MKRFISKYRHGLVIALYSIIYILLFSYLEHRPVHSYHIVHTVFDDWIPFCEFFIVPYMLWFPYMILAVIYFIFFNKNKHEYYQLAFNLMMGMTVFLIVSYVYPNAQHLRPTEFPRDNIFTDIYPDAVKIGMVSSSTLIGKIADKLEEYKAGNIVVDPVMVATSGAKLISDEAIEILKQRLLPISSVLTPNIPEAEVLAEMEIHTADDMIAAAKKISDTYHCAVLCKGGHKLNDANDLLYRDGSYRWFEGKRINNPNTHGTGCTLSSAIASNLAKGFDLDTSVERAKDYISGALAAMLDLGKGSGPMDHGFAITGEYKKESERE